MTLHARCTGNHTAFMYIEDDDFLGWEALLGWAADQAPLASLGFTRSFARVETRTADGPPAHLAWTAPEPGSRTLTRPAQPASWGTCSARHRSWQRCLSCQVSADTCVDADACTAPPHNAGPQVRRTCMLHGTDVAGCDDHIFGVARRRTRAPLRDSFPRPQRTVRHRL